MCLEVYDKKVSVSKEKRVKMMRSEKKKIEEQENSFS